MKKKIKNLIFKKFYIPNYLINKEIPIKKENSKLLIYYKKTKKIIHDKFYNINKYINNKNIIIRNNTKVFVSKIIGKKEKNNSNIEIFLIKEINPYYHIWDVLVKPARKVRVGNKIIFNINKKKKLYSEIINNTTSKGRLLKFIFKKGKNFKLKKILYKIGKIILPDNIKKKYLKNLKLNILQNIYAKNYGSIYLPNEGIHFSKNTFLKFKLKKIKIFDITLHLNLNSFINININNINKYKIHSEKLIIKKKISNNINKEIKKKKKICCIGINTLKGIESIVKYDKIKPFNGNINTLINYPLKIRIIDSLITNFLNTNNLSFITLSSFCGYKNIINIYKEAIKNKYKFLNYGDVLLIK
ncbi:MAG: S-adenosylmethionine:tRNA ribosyltransferase-isomerase [Candidatus Shikimatogenerans bostrichidophilus]|nr:MAG: S-adenosylmethionine:tRNA ribosyltransferase-isomerase [Candidatus Shikimatogenerans bostrichidophilus]